jgi:glycosyltransferase involved in cell wall biosynthesis
MHIYWFTGRSLKDLCSTTQISLASGLIHRGYELTFVNSDEKGSHEEWPWLHQSLPIHAPLGLRSRILGKQMYAWFKQCDTKKECVALVDWKVANTMIPLFELRKIPWILIDRSPPADKGVLSLLQWPSWKKSWKHVRMKQSGEGCVVSEMHQQFVQKKVNVNPSAITVLPAGVDLQRFKPGKRFPSLTMVYHGQLDRHRGVLALPIFLQNIRNSRLDVRLIMVGMGDCFNRLQMMAEENEHFEIHSTLPQPKLAQLLSQCHIGLLPMPENKIWAIASPLKRSEYAASGLLIYGIDHAGHRFSTNDSMDWMKLVRQEEFHEKGIQWLQELQPELREQLGLQARTYAEENLSWENSVDSLEQCIVSLTDKVL